MGRRKKTDTSDLSGELTREQMKRIMQIDDFLAGERFLIDAYRKLKFSNDIMKSLETVTMAYGVATRLEAEAEYRVEKQKAKNLAFYADLEEEAYESGFLLKPTDQRIKAYIERNEEYQQRRLKLADYQRSLNIYKGYVKALKMKAEMLRTKAATLRQQDEAEKE